MENKLNSPATLKKIQIFEDVGLFCRILRI